MQCWFRCSIWTHEGGKSECFRCSAQDACQHIEALLEEWQDQPVAGIHRFGQGVICRAYEEELHTLFYGPRIPANPIDGLHM